MRGRVGWDSAGGRQEHVRVLPRMLVGDDAISGWELLSTSCHTNYHQPRRGMVRKKE